MLVAVSCRIHLNRAAGVDGPGHHVHRTCIPTITSFGAISMIIPYVTNAHTLQELQTKVTLLLKGSQVTLRDRVDNFAVRLQRVHEVEEPHIEHVLTRRSHAHKLSMRVSFHFCIICFCAIKNYEYTIHRSVCFLPLCFLIGLISMIFTGHYNSVKHGPS